MRRTSLCLLLASLLVLTLSCRKSPAPDPVASETQEDSKITNLVRTASPEVERVKAELIPPPQPAAQLPSRVQETNPPPIAPVAPPGPSLADTQKGVLLKVNWPAGSRYVYRMDLEQHSTNRLAGSKKSRREDLALGMSYAISAGTAEEKEELEVEFMAYDVAIKLDGLLAIGFDSATPSSSPPDPITAPFKRVIGSKIRLLTDAKGTIAKVLGLQEWTAQVVGEGKGPAAELLGQQFNEGFFKQIGDFGRGLPSRPVEVGDHWPFKTELPAGALGTIALDSTVTLSRWEDHEQQRLAMLESKGAITSVPGPEAKPEPGALSVLSGTVTGKSWFDPKPGVLMESIVDQWMRLGTSVPGGSGGAADQFTSDIGQKVTLKLVESSRRP